MKARTIFIAIAILFVGCLAGFVGLARHSFRREEMPVETGLRGEALLNPVLLTEKWIHAQGRKARTTGGVLQASQFPKGGVVILMDLAQPLDEADVESLLTWVEAGGHLITDGSASPFNDERGLLALHSQMAVKLVGVVGGKGVCFDDLVPGERPFRINRHPGWRLHAQDPQQWPIVTGRPEASRLLSGPWVKGRITLTPDLSFLRATGLTHFDHAEYLKYLLDLQPGQGEVVLWAQPVEQSLLRWLWRSGAPVVIALALVMIAWLWGGFFRLGPMQPSPVPRRRSILEHVVSMGRFIWKSGGEEHLLRVTREALERKAKGLNPAYPHLDLEEKAKWLAEHGGGSMETIASALEHRPGMPRDYFAQSILTLEVLRQKL